MTLSDVVCCLNRAAQLDFTTTDTVEIIVISNRKLGRKKRSRYTWAWRESAENGVFGCADSLDEIKQRAERMFPGARLILFLL